MSTTLYAEIVKAERNADGDLVVVGKATGPDLDLDQQICDPAWLAKAMPEWMSTGGNLREQHSSIAAGVATELSQQGDSWMVAGLIVDPVSARKVEKGVLKGYSIGIKNPLVIKDKAAPGGRITGGSVVEVSLVDRPCNPTCTLTLAKAAKPGAGAEPDEVDEAPVLVKVEELTESADDEVSIHVGGSRFTPSDLAKLLAKKSGPVATKSDDDDDDKDDDGKPDGDDAGDGNGASSDSDDDGDGDGDKDQKKKAKAKARADKKNAKQAAQAGSAKGALAPLKPGGKPRYPIKTVDDLKDAILAFGRGRKADRADIKAHIISEAKRLGRPDLIPDNWKAADADLSKAGDGDGGDGQKHDSDDIAAVRDGLVALINAELQELCDGEPELCDVEQLLCSLRLLMSWWSKEAAGGETDPPYTNGDSDMAYVGLDATPDQTTAPTPDATKTAPVEATAEADADATKTTEPDATKVEDSAEHDRLTELVKSAVAKQTKPLIKASKKAVKERDALAAELDQVKADLAKALSLPEPGGPVLTRTAAQADAARNADAEQIKTQVADLLQKANTASDPYLAKGYRDRAAALAEKAA